MRPVLSRADYHGPMQEHGPITPFYLPVTAADAAAFFDDGCQPALPVQQAALFAAISQLAKPLPASGLQALLIQAEALFQAQPEAGAEALDQARRQLAALSAAAIRRQLASQAITYAPDELMYRQAWAGADGRYHPHFQRQCQGQLQPFAIRLGAGSDSTDDFPERARRLPRPQIDTQGTRDQQVVASVIGAVDGEHVQVHAYAGTGKTHLIHTLTAVLSTAFTYIAPSQGHLFGFEQAAKASANPVRALHLWALAHELARRNAQRLQLGHVPRWVQATYPAHEQAQALGIRAIGPYSPGQVVSLCHRIIKRWCHSPSPLLGLREVQPHAHGSGPVAASLLASCEHIWEQMFQRQQRHGHLLGVDIVHLAKWLMLTGAQIPASYGTLIIDEAHDLQPAWQYLFSRYPGGCVQLGDPNQCLRGRPRPVSGTQQLWMGQSVRIGNGIEQLVNTTLALAGNDPLAVEFAAARGHITARRPYDPGESTPEAGLRVFGDPAALLDTLLRLPADATGVAVLPASARQLRQHGLGLVDQFRQQQARISQLWPATASALDQAGQHALLGTIERGWSTAQIDALLARHADTGSATLLLGLVEHAKNLEADVVTLAPCCFDSSVAQRQLHPARAVYLAMSRARHALWLPGQGMDQLIDRLGQGSR